MSKKLLSTFLVLILLISTTLTSFAATKTLTDNLIYGAYYDGATIYEIKKGTVTAYFREFATSKFAKAYTMKFKAIKYNKAKNTATVSIDSGDFIFSLDKKGKIAGKVEAEDFRTTFYDLKKADAKAMMAYLVKDKTFISTVKNEGEADANAKANALEAAAANNAKEAAVSKLLKVLWLEGEYYISGAEVNVNISKGQVGVEDIINGQFFGYNVVSAKPIMDAEGGVYGLDYVFELNGVKCAAFFQLSVDAPDNRTLYVMPSIDHGDLPSLEALPSETVLTFAH